MVIDLVTESFESSRADSGVEAVRLSGAVAIRSYEPDAVESALKDRLMCFTCWSRGRLLRQ